MKDIEFFVEGRMIKKQEIGTPFLLRSIGSSNDEIAAKDLCGLSLVVPCYNEEARLP